MDIWLLGGRLAQLVEQDVYTIKVGGSSPSSPTMKEIECIVTGRVQAVSFRAYAKYAADRLGIVGTVENMDDGSVRAVAQGTVNALNEFIEQLRTASDPARIDDVAVTERKTLGTYDGFVIVYKYD